MVSTATQIAVLKAKKFGCAPFQWLAVALGLLGGYLIVAQVVLWMKSGQWIEMPLLYLFINPWPEISSKVYLLEIAPEVGMFSNPFVILGVEQLVVPTDGRYWETYRYFGTFSEWLTAPQSWLGLHKIVRGIFELVPISLCCFILAGVSGGIATAYSEIFQDEIERLLKQS